MIPAATTNQTGTYKVWVSDASGGSASSVPVTLTVVPPPPPPPTPTITSIGLSPDGTSAILQFTSPSGSDTTNSFTLQNSIDLANPIDFGFTNVVPAPSFTLSNSVFTVQTPTNGGASFYRLLHN